MGTGYLDQLKQEAFEVNMGIVRDRLVLLTWGNASSFDRSNGIFAIKPSGVSYSLLKWQDMVLVDLEGNVIDSKLKPSSIGSNVVLITSILLEIVLMPRVPIEATFFLFSFNI